MPSHRLRWTSLGGVPRASLPTVGTDSRPKILVITLNALGWRSYAQRLDEFLPTRTDFIGMHLPMHTPPWMRLLNHEFAIGRGKRRMMHPIRSWELLFKNWIRRDRLPLDWFDVVYVAPITIMMGISKQTTRKFRLAASCDTTGPSYSWMAAGSPGGVYKPGSFSPDPREATLIGSTQLMTPWTPGIATAIKQDYAYPDSQIQVSPPVVPDHLLERRVPTAAKPSNILRLVFVGNDFKRKGGHKLLEWHQQRWADRCELHIASSGAVPDHQLKNVIWHGGVPNDRLVGELLPTMDVFVFPTDGDTVGIVLAEAQCCGLPVVTRRIGFLPDMLSDGKTGFLFDPKDDEGFVAAVERLITDADLRHRMSAAAREWAIERFSMRRTFNSLFDRLVELATPAL